MRIHMMIYSAHLRALSPLNSAMERATTRAHFTALAIGLCLIPHFGRCSEVTSDEISISTANAISGGSILFSSSVFFTPNSSLRLQGPTGVLESGSTITASAFFGDGSHLDAVARPTSTQTFSGANTFLSSFSIVSGGRDILFSTSPTGMNVSLSSAGLLSFYPELHNSSATSMAQFSTTISSYGPCIVGSTLTIITSGGRIELNFTGAIQAEGGIGFLVDGIFVGDLTGDKGFTVRRNDETSDYLTVGVSYITESLTPGSHSFCVSLASRRSGGFTTTMLTDSTAFSNQFYVKEIK